MGYLENQQSSVETYKDHFKPTKLTLDVQNLPLRYETQTHKTHIRLTNFTLDLHNLPY